MRFQEKIRTILKYVSGLLAAISVIGLIGTTGSDFLGNISCKWFYSLLFSVVLWRPVWQFIGLSNKFCCRQPKESEVIS